MEWKIGENRKNRKNESGAFRRYFVNLTSLCQLQTHAIECIQRIELFRCNLKLRRDEGVVDDELEAPWKHSDDSTSWTSEKRQKSIRRRRELRIWTESGGECTPWVAEGSGIFGASSSTIYQPALPEKSFLKQGGPGIWMPDRGLGGGVGLWGLKKIY